MSQQLYIPLSEEINEQLNSLANRYGMTAPLFAAELLRCIVSDESITKGSCIIIANNGVIDADIKTQLAILQNAFGIYKGGL